MPDLPIVRRSIVGTQIREPVFTTREKDRMAIVWHAPRALRLVDIELEVVDGRASSVVVEQLDMGRMRLLVADDSLDPDCRCSTCLELRQSFELGPSPTVAVLNEARRRGKAFDPLLVGVVDKLCPAAGSDQLPAVPWLARRGELLRIYVKCRQGDLTNIFVSYQEVDPPTKIV